MITYKLKMTICIIFACTLQTLFGIAGDSELLLYRLDLNKPGLEKVKKLTDNPEAAAKELLAYYRTRTSVKHATPRASKSAIGRSASRKDLKMADDALKHILVGQRSYGSFFRGDDIDWDTNAVADKEWIWQLHRMFFWEAMAKAYLHTGNEKYAKEWGFQLKDWYRKNPRDKHHRHAWRSIEAGIRGYHWTSLYQRFLDSPSFTPDVLVTFLNSCHDHASFLMTKYSKKSNWGLMEAEGMAFIALTFPEFKESDKWLKEAISRLNKEITNQVNPDGYQRELSMGYHTGCISWFMRTLKMAELNGKTDLFPPIYLETIEKMCTAVMKISFPNGSSPQFGDSKNSKPGSIYKSLKAWADLFDRPDLLYVATQGKEGTEPGTTFALKESGFYSMRSGWEKDAICMVLKCGGNGGFHCQPDNGSFELFAGGRYLMPDSGCYIYSGDPVNRNWFRATRNHQTLTLNEKNSAYAPKLLLWQPGKDCDILSIENKSYKNLTHRRTICFVDKKYFVIIDDAYGTDTGDIDLNFQLAPGKAVFDKHKLTARTDFKDGWNVMLQAVSPENLTMEEVEGQVSFHYTKKQPRPAFRYRMKKENESSLRFITLLIPYKGTQPSINASLAEITDSNISEMRLILKQNDKTRTISYSLPEIN